MSACQTFILHDFTGELFVTNFANNIINFEGLVIKSRNDASCYDSLFVLIL